MSNRNRSQQQSHPPQGQTSQQILTTPQINAQVAATFTPLQLPVSASHLISSPQNQGASLNQSIIYRAENNTQFSHAKAILWEIKFIISGLVSKKSVAQVTTDLQQLSLQFDKEFDKYLVRELIEQIDLKDPSKPNRDRSEPVKCTLLSQELTRMCTSPNFLLFFDEISKYIFGENRHKEFLKELASRLKLTAKMQLHIALSLYESSLSEEDRQESAKLIKSKLIEYHQAGNNKPELFEDYALHRLLHIFRLNSDFDSSLDGASAAPFEAAKKYLLEQHQIKSCQHVALRLTTCDGDLINYNPTLDDPTNSLIRIGSGLSHLTQVSKLIEPWEVLLDLGQSSSLNYQMLSMALQDFKEINEKMMANMLLHLAVYYQGQDDLHTRIVFGVFETNKLGDATKLKSEPSDKQTQSQWHVQHFSRAFRENYTHLNWTKVLESFAELSNDCLQHHEKLDSKAYSFFLQLFNKSKPQNVQVPISLLLDEKWLNSNLQLQFIQNAINAYISGEDKTFQFSKCPKKIGQVSELPDINSLMIDVWSSPEVLQALLNLSETQSYHTVRKILDQPLQSCPEYLLLALSQAKIEKGHFLLDELLSTLMRGFIDVYPTSNIVLKKLWDFNQELMIRTISEICLTTDIKMNQKLNLNKALEITQQIPDSLIRFVKSNDSNFTTSLGILAASRDYLNYDAWINERIQTVGPQFIRSLARYLINNIFRPIQCQLIKNKLSIKQSLSPEQSTLSEAEITEEQKKIDFEINTALERANISKERLFLTIEHFQTYTTGQSDESAASSLAPSEHILKVVRDVMEAFKVIFPSHSMTQQQQEIEKIANKYFESVFNADLEVVDQRIAEFLQKMHALSLTRHQNARDSEIFSRIVHTFFDEYRFIVSFRERKFLISFAKLFGGIINKSILDNTLMDLAVQFTIQTLQNSDVRLTFGIEALKQFYQQLVDLPDHFQKIYKNYDSKILEYDPVFHAQFVNLYNQRFQTTQKSSAQKQSQEAPRPKFNTQEIQSSLSEGDYEVQTEIKKQVKGQDRGDSLKAANKPETTKPAGTNNQKQAGKINQQSQQPVFTIDKRKSPDQLAAQKPQKVEEPRSIQPQLDFKTQQTQEGFLLKIDSAPFTNQPNQSDIQIPQIIQEVKPIINMDAVAFNPNQVVFQPDYQSGREQKQSSDIQSWQEHQDKIISEARKSNRTEIPISELIEDSKLISIPTDYQKDIRFICNNTGRETSQQRLEEANKLLAGPNPDLTLNWFLHYFLTQRLMNLQPQLNLFIDMFKKFNIKNVISKCIKCCIDILKRCMLIQEEDIQLVMKRGQGNSNPIKNYVQMLGTFVGMLTFANNRPIQRSEFDIKQLLIESFQTKNRLGILFVCRVIKESTKSQFGVFAKKNPLIRSLLEILKEGQDLNILQLRPGDDFIHEFSSVFKEFQFNQQMDQQSQSILRAHYFNQMPFLQQQQEVIFYDKKAPIIPIRIKPNKDVQNDFEASSELNPNNEEFQEEFEDEIRRFNNQDEIYPFVVIQPSTLDSLQKVFNITENEMKRLLSEAIEVSIKEILPPVVTRSVSIALITTRELVLKDFTYDSDVSKVTNAIDQIVKNLAGSLALVTCREPLRIQLTVNLVKDIKQSCFQFGSKNGLRKQDDLRKDQSMVSLNEASMMEQKLRDFINANEDLILPVAQDLSKDNLELGCKIVKQTVFENASRRIQQDEEIKKAIDKRLNAAQSGRNFVDETYVQNFAELPERLKPNRSGLTPQQLKVYSDFSKLNQQYVRLENHHQYILSQQPLNTNSRRQQQQHYTPQLLSRQSQQEISSETQGSNKHQQIAGVHSFSLAQILKELDQIETEEVTLLQRTVLTMKVQELNKMALNNTDNLQVKKNFENDCKELWRFTEKKFKHMFTLTNLKEANQIIGILSIIVNKFKLVDFALKLSEVYFQFEQDEILNEYLTSALIGKGIISAKEWDRRFSLVVRDTSGNTMERVLQFLTSFVENVNFKYQIEQSQAEKQYPNLQKVVKQLEQLSGFDTNSTSQTSKLQLIKEGFQVSPQSASYTQLKNFFIKWVELSYLSDSNAQQQGMNAYFAEFGSMVPVDHDLGKLFEFCNVMIQTSIDLACQSNNGERLQNNSLLNYNFIDSFVKLVFVIMSIFEINKQELMTKILELIKQKLDHDHKSLQRNFNQKPYFRMLINLLTAVNIGNCFNQRAQRQILFEIADLLKDLSPDKYPGFAFAWLEIISHRFFMPHFIKRSDQNSNQGLFILKDLLVSCFNFLKQNMVQGQQTTNAVEAYYRGTMRVVLFILKDHKDFLSQFHVSFVSSLPDHAIQLKNIILYAYPDNIKQMPDPFDLDLNIRLENARDPEILSSFEANLSVNNLREDLDSYLRSNSDALLHEICNKITQSKERINGRETPSNALINAVVLYILQKASEEQVTDVFSNVITNLNDETRVCFINSTVNELRYPNSHTYQVCLILTKIYRKSNARIKDQITRVLFERLQAHPPHPWGLLIIFREFNQNGDLQFSQGDFNRNNKEVIDYLFEDRLHRFSRLISALQPQQMQ